MRAFSFFALLGVLTLASLGATACGESEPTSSVVVEDQADSGSDEDLQAKRHRCYEDPSVCPSGTTCWHVDGSGSNFDCLKSSEEAVLGAPCKPFIGTPAPCGDGLICVASPGESEGICRAFCAGAERSCGAGEVCFTLTFSGAEGEDAPRLHVCQPAD